MDVNLIAALIGIVAGAFGYWFSTFSVQPILRFREIRYRIHSEFIYYAQVVNAKNLNEEMQEFHRERIRANRKSSSQLSAAYIELPFWFRCYVNIMGLRPRDAVRHLIGFSNTTDYQEAHKLEIAIKKALNLPKEI